MPEYEALVRLLAGKHVLVDSCILICASNKETAKTYVPFLSFFKDANASLVVSEPVYLEFVRGASSLKQKKILDELLKQIGVISILPTTPNIWKFTLDLSLLYSFQRKNWSKQVSIVDCVNAAWLRQQRDLYLITEDVQDYPSTIFDIVHIWPLELPENDRSHGMIYIMKFNKTKFESEIQRLMQS